MSRMKPTTSRNVLLPLAFGPDQYVEATQVDIYMPETAVVQSLNLGYHGLPHLLRDHSQFHHPRHFVPPEVYHLHRNPLVLTGWKGNDLVPRICSNASGSICALSARCSLSHASLSPGKNA